MPNEEIAQKIPSDGELLRTWYAVQPIGEAAESRIKILKACSWTMDQWYNSIYGRRKITDLEKKAINEEAKQDVFKLEGVDK